MVPPCPAHPKKRRFHTVSSIAASAAAWRLGGEGKDATTCALTRGGGCPKRKDGVDDAALLAGHVALVCGYHDLAQELFLASSHPISALEMRRDLLDWEVALKLAQTLAPDQVPSISREFAMQLEFREEYEPALAMFNNGLATRDAAQRARARLAPFVAASTAPSSSPCSPLFSCENALARQSGRLAPRAVARP